MPQLIFDPHVHFIDLGKGQYHWLRNAKENWLPGINQIKTNHSEADLELKSPFQLAGVTHIEAGFDNQQPERELAFLQQTSICSATISYLALDSDPVIFEQKLSLLMLFKGFIGIRDITEGADYQRLLSPFALKNLTTLTKYHLIFEAQLELHNSIAVKIIDHFAQVLPQLIIVLNHSGFPEPRYFRQWQQSIKVLAQHQNLSIKYSGAEMVNAQLSSKFKQNVLDELIQQFTDSRVMFASNFPLCLTQKSYHDIWLEYSEMEFAPASWSKLSHENAIKIYQSI